MRELKMGATLYPPSFFLIICLECRTHALPPATRAANEAYHHPLNHQLLSRIEIRKA